MEKQTMDVKRERVVLALRSVLVIAGAFVVVVGASGMIGHVIIETPIHDNLGFFVLIIGGAVLVLTGVFKTGLFIDFFVQSF